MKTVNRSIAIIRPKRHFMKWANSNTLDECEFSFEYFTEHHSFTVLIPYYDILIRNQAKRYINAHCGLIFEYQLQRWNPNEKSWPNDRSREVFNKWFTVEYIYDVIE